MKTLHLFPPNYAAINKAFNVRGKGVWFCYGDTIYNPSRRPVPAAILAHERVHSAQQGDDPAGWWERYIDDIAFRLAQEKPAHSAELRWFRDCGEANERVLDNIAARLASPLYGNMIDYAEARRFLVGANAPSASTTPIAWQSRHSTAPATQSG